MKVCSVSVALFAILAATTTTMMTNSFSLLPSVSSTTTTTRRMQQLSPLFSHSSLQVQQPSETTTLTTSPASFSSRRSLFAAAAVTMAAVGSTTVPVAVAAAAAEEETAAAVVVPLISTDEFQLILRDSARSISRVEFTGPKSETVRVYLQDGLVFGLNDVIESPTDPRSPLKISAYCRENSVQVSYPQLQAFLTNPDSIGQNGKKKKRYANSRVLEAAEKEKEKASRMAADEQQRLEELARMQE